MKQVTQDANIELSASAQRSNACRLHHSGAGTWPGEKSLDVALMRGVGKGGGRGPRNGAPDLRGLATRTGPLFGRFPRIQPLQRNGLVLGLRVWGGGGGRGGGQRPEAEASSQPRRPVPC